MGAREFMIKLIRMRAATIKMGVCGKDVKLESETLNRVKRWMDFWNPNDEQCKNYICKNQMDVLTLMPGGKNYEAWMKRFNSLING